MVKIFGLATNIDHAVYRAGPAEHPAARIEYCPVVYAGIGLGLEAPRQLWMIQQFYVAGRNMDQRVPVAPSGLKQQDALAGILAQPVRQHTSRRARTDDHVIRLHAYAPFDPDYIYQKNHGKHRAIIIPPSSRVSVLIIAQDSPIGQSPLVLVYECRRMHRAHPRRRKHERWRETTCAADE